MSIMPISHLPPDVQEMVEAGEKFLPDTWREISREWGPWAHFMAMFACSKTEAQRRESALASDPENLAALFPGGEISDDGAVNVSISIFYLSDAALRRLWEGIDGPKVARNLPPKLRAQVRARMMN